MNISIEEFNKYTDLDIDENYFKRNNIVSSFDEYIKSVDLTQNSRKEILALFCEKWMDENYYEQIRLIKYYRKDD